MPRRMIGWAPAPRAARVSSSGDGDSTQPELPRVFIDTSAVPAITGATWTPANGAAFQTALDGAALGDLIVLTAGSTYTGSFTLPNKTSGSGWITIRSSAHASLPFGTRVGPGDVADMPTLLGSGGAPVLVCADAAHHFWFIGIEMRAPTTPATSNLVSLVQPSTTVEASMPTDITVDRCYIHGDATIGARRGLSLHGRRMAVIESYVSDFKDEFNDTQAVWMAAGWGPFKIVNNYLEASTENVMFGGADPAIVGVIPSDVEIRRNYIFKPLTWKEGDPSYLGTPWNVKNCIESKCSQRVLIDGNIIEHNWIGGDQFGFAIVLKSENQDGTAPLSVTRDWTVTNNVIIDSVCGVNMAGLAGANPSVIATRIRIANNAFLDPNGILDRLFQILTSADAITIDHNVGLPVSAFGIAVLPAGPSSTRVMITNNIMGYGTSGIDGTGQTEGVNTINAYLPGAVVNRNLFVGVNALGEPTYPAVTYAETNGANVGFVAWVPGSDYHDAALAPGSPYIALGTDGQPLGINAAAIAAAQAG